MTTDDALLTASLWQRSPSTGVRIAWRRRGASVWTGLPFIVQPRSWPAFYRQARRTRGEYEYARVSAGEYVDVL